MRAVDKPHGRGGVINTNAVGIACCHVTDVLSMSIIYTHGIRNRAVRQWCTCIHRYAAEIGVTGIVVYVRKKSMSTLVRALRDDLQPRRSIAIRTAPIGRRSQ